MADRNGVDLHRRFAGQDVEGGSTVVRCRISRDIPRPESANDERRIPSPGRGSKNAGLGIANDGYLLWREWNDADEEGANREFGADANAGRGTGYGRRAIADLTPRMIDVFTVVKVRRYR